MDVRVEISDLIAILKLMFSAAVVDSFTTPFFL
jgi:hypothetical protein